MDMMDVIGELEMERSCSCRRLRYTKWRLRKCLLAEGEKLWVKWKADAVKATARKFRPHGRDRKAQNKGVYWQRFVGCCHKDRSFERPREIRVGPGAVPVGSMAPENTTQYLMDNAFRDLLNDCGNQTFPSADCHDAIDLSLREDSLQLYGEAHSPRSMYASLDSTYESTILFQQRDFEDMFHRYSEFNAKMQS